MRYGSLTRLLTVLALPIFIDTLLVMTLGAADTFMLSRYSDESVAAVGLVNQLVNIVFIIFQVISMATSILCSQYVGAGQRDRVLQVMGVSVLFNFLIGLAFSAFLFGKASAVDRLSTWFQGKLRILLKGYPDDEITVSKEKVAAVKRWLDS